MTSIGAVRSSLLLAITSATVLLAAPAASADDTIRHPGEHPPYFVEIEPHLDFAWGDWTSGLGGGPGYGVGGRFSFSIVKNGFVPSINNSVAIGVGLDFLHFGCAEGFDGGRYGCSLNSLSFPVVLQWNFYVSRQWSVFGEPGLFLYHQFFDYSGETCNGAGCPGVTATSILPALYVGARYHLNDRMSLTMRVGYPTITFGISFFD
jgi:hypothetical protein